VRTLAPALTISVRLPLSPNAACNPKERLAVVVRALYEDPPRVTRAIVDAVEREPEVEVGVDANAEDGARVVAPSGRRLPDFGGDAIAAAELVANHERGLGQPRGEEAEAERDS
jgi:hypothetical protein